MSTRNFLLLVVLAVASVLAPGCSPREVEVVVVVPDAGAVAPDAGHGADTGAPPTWKVSSEKLVSGWKIQSSDVASDPGEKISTVSYDPQGWYGTSVPSTVFAALVLNNVYPDPFFGMNLRSVPGVDYPLGTNFSEFDMPNDSPFKVPWWYRAVFDVPEDARAGRVWLRFDGVNYEADVFVNGVKIAGFAEMKGAYRRFDYDVTGAVAFGGKNAVAVRVAAPKPTDLAITFVDWNPAPPDKMMGLWNDVVLLRSGPVVLRDPYVQSQIDAPSPGMASLTVSATVENATDAEVSGTLEGAIESATFSQGVTLAPREARRVTFAPDAFTALRFASPRLWWPWQYGKPDLYSLGLQFTVGGAVSDSLSRRFGIREFNSVFTADGSRMFLVNHLKVLIRGAGWTPDMLYRRDPAREEADVRYVRAMNLNAIRLEGKLGFEHLLDQCDEQGVLVIAGWCCCDHWERWSEWKEEQHEVSVASLRDQIRSLRNHPSVIAWLNGSDNPPPSDVEQAYLKVLEDEGWPYDLTVPSADDRPAEYSGPSGVKMTGPYEWVPPHYWLTNKDRGGAFGFNTETSPGPAVPLAESLRRFIPADHLWPIDAIWNFHAGGGSFQTINVFSNALNWRHGGARDLDDFERKSQLMAYEGIRAMFEAYGANKYASTGVIQWMLNNAWPSLIWNLYDWYLKPGGGFFGAKEACQPVHVMYRYDDATVVVVNSQYSEHKGLTVSAKVYASDLSERFSRDETVDLDPDAVATAFPIPPVTGLGKTYLLRLKLKDSGGAVIDDNLYWLSTKPDVLDDANADWYHTPVSQYADMAGLNDLPAATVSASAVSVTSGDTDTVTITLENAGGTLAFFVHAEIIRGPGGEEVVPVVYGDNYVSVWPSPNETRVFTATYRTADLHGFAPYLRVSGFNVAGTEQPVGR